MGFTQCMTITQKEVFRMLTIKKTKWRMKYCPKCGGDCYLDQDEYGEYWHCFQAGHEIRSLKQLPGAYGMNKKHRSSIR